MILGIFCLGESIFGSASVYIVTTNKSCEFHTQKIQLVMSLKFHVRETLSNLPLDVAVDAITDAWQFCQVDVDNDATLVCDWPRVDRESRL